MSIDTTSNSHGLAFESAAGSPQDTDFEGSPSSATPEMVQATRHEVRQITQEIAEFSQQDISSDTFFSHFLQRVTTALASASGTVWRVGPGENLQAIAQVNGSSIGVQDEQHQQVLQRAIALARPIALAPRSTSTELGTANATDHLQLIAPLCIEGHVIALVEVFQRPHRGPATQRGYMTYLMQVCELAESFLSREQLRDLKDHRQWSVQLEQFLSQIHSHLSVEETSYCIANEARRLSQADRVSLAMGIGRRCRVKVVSGLDNVDRRAEQVRQLGRLVAQVMKGREPIWFDTHNGELPPQIEEDWNRYVDISHVRRCVVIPLFPPPVSGEADSTGEPHGALVFEQLSDTWKGSEHTDQITKIARHSASALHNALQHENLFLMPLWRLLGNACEALGGRHFLKTLLAILLCVGAIIALVATTTDFAVPVRGKMQPELRRTIFARQDGVIVSVPVEHGQNVQPGQVLAELKSTDLDVEITTLVGRQTATREQTLSLQRALLDDPGLETAEQNRINGELLRLQQIALSIERQLELLRQKEQQLVVRANCAGQVVTWHVQERLLHRPVQQGQALMSVVDPTAEWELELFVPARHSGHVLDAAAATDQPLQVTFVLSSHPGERFVGTLKAIDQAAVEHEELGSAVRIRVAIDARELPELKTDATVVAKIHCGKRSLGYAWFHDLLDTVQSRVLFWL